MKIKIKIDSVSLKVLALYTRFLLKLLLLNKIETKIVYLPKITNRLTFQKSPHVFKKAKEHFEVKKISNVIFCNLNLQKLKYFLLNKPNTIKIKVTYEKRR